MADELSNKGYKVCQRTVCDLLADLDYSLQSNKKAREGANHPDRDAQFQYINEKLKYFRFRKNPSISVDTKKKENIGNYKNEGKEYNKIIDCFADSDFIGITSIVEIGTSNLPVNMCLTHKPRS